MDCEGSANGLEFVYCVLLFHDTDLETPYLQFSQSIDADFDRLFIDNVFNDPRLFFLGGLSFSVGFKTNQKLIPV